MPLGKPLPLGEHHFMAANKGKFNQFVRDMLPGYGDVAGAYGAAPAPAPAPAPVRSWRDRKAGKGNSKKSKKSSKKERGGQGGRSYQNPALRRNDSTAPSSRRGRQETFDDSSSDDGSDDVFSGRRGAPASAGALDATRKVQCMTPAKTSSPALRARRLSRTQEKALASAARRMSPRVRKSRGMHPQLRGAAIWIALWLIYMMRASGDLSQPALMPHEEEMLRTQSLQQSGAVHLDSLPASQTRDLLRALSRETSTMQKVLVLRYARVRELTNLWRAGDVAAVVAALSAQPAESGEQAQPDPAADALLADFLNSIESRSVSRNSLGVATHLLPLATRLLGSRFEDHVLAGLHALDLLTKALVEDASLTGGDAGLTPSDASKALFCYNLIARARHGVNDLTDSKHDQAVVHRARRILEALDELLRIE
eukprot:INCI16215.2.p1 GENE.INCI16215.2~~INCI16215.2.p1  ORF type:complete len:426 (+),score=69.91 INCI16215.2:167-1444(+)